jgi:DNA-binding GntR family transcriptional regulator
MDSQLKAWKLRADRFWSAASPDYREAAQLAADIAGSRADEALRKAAAQALPSLRNAMPARADRSTRDLARRRLSVVRDLLHTLDDRFHETCIMELMVWWRIPRLRLAKRGAGSWQDGGE